MMKNMFKQSIAMVLAFLLMVSACCCGVFAQTDLEPITQKINAMPELSSFVSPTDVGVDKALADAQDMITLLAELTDDEFYNLENSSKVFDLYVGLTLMKLQDGMPTEIPTKDDLMDQLRWLYESTVTNTDLVGSLMYYTSPVESEDPDMLSTLGETLYLDYIEKLMEVLTRISATMTTMTEEEQAAIEAEAFSWALDEYPETFTVDNFWDYAADFYMNVYDTLPEGGLGEEDTARYQALADSFTNLVENERPFIIEALEKKIAANCDVEKASVASELALVLYHEPVCDAIFNDLDLLGWLYEEDASLLVSNYEVYEEYDAIVYPWVYEDYSYGDLNGDGNINAVDALMVLKMAVGKLEATEDDYWIGDVDGDSELNAKDALYILRYAVGKIDYFPVEEVVFE